MMTGEDKKRRIFVSAATGEFRSLRLRLAGSLQRAGFEVEHQDIFPSTDADTVRKLADLLSECVLVIHLVGKEPGSLANKHALKDLLHNIPADTLLPKHPELRKALGDFIDITYTQWEAFFALHFGVPLLVYAPADAENNDEFPQQEHLARLKIARRYPEWCADDAEYFAKILPDVTRGLGTPVEAITQEIAPPKFLNHAAENFLGREPELALLDDAWDTSTELVNVLSMIAWGGVGKTALLAEWIQQRFIAREWKDENGEPELWRYFDWSFYEQGTTSGDDEEAAADGKIAVRTGSVGDFFERALTFFGDPDPNLPGKGARLARLVQQQRSLLILDGMEPLQQPFNHPQAGQLIDNDLHDLLCALALKNPGLCVVTSRQPLADLAGLRNGASKESQLSELPIETAIRLLRNLQITGTDEELAEASEAFGRHALSLTLLGRFLYDAHGGDIRKRDLIDLQDADDATRPDRKRTAWKVLEVYDAWLASATGRPEELAILRLTGLFDRPANANCLAALRAEPVIPGLTDAIVGLSESRWNILLNRLERAHLIVLRGEENGAKGIDAHPLIREYFSKQLRDKQPDAFKTAHSRLFDHLCETTEHQPDTLEGLQPLYQAVVHGCLAEREAEASDVMKERIYRGTGDTGFYSNKKLGAISENLRATASFFDVPWGKISPRIKPLERGWHLNEASHSLAALGRLTEAVDPLVLGINEKIKMNDLPNVAALTCNLSSLELQLGNIAEASKNAQDAIGYSMEIENQFLEACYTSVYANCLHMSGNLEAVYYFEKAEKMQEGSGGWSILLSVRGFYYCQFMLSFAERSAWLCLLSSNSKTERRSEPIEAVTAAQEEVFARLGKIRDWRNHTQLADQYSIYDIAHDQLSLARAGLFSLVAQNDFANAGEMSQPLLNAAVKTIRASRRFGDLPEFLLTIAFAKGLIGDSTTCRNLLNEAQQIAERGPMPLHLADVHLHRARLFHDKSELARAAELIHKHKYGRRYEELADAEEAAKNW